MQRRFAAILGLLFLAASTAGAVAAQQPAPPAGPSTATGQRAAGPPPLSNLQIFPKETPREQVIAAMQRFTQALGVQCNYCHVQEGRGGRNDFASDEKQPKKTARQMMILSRDLNEKLPSVVGKPANETTRVGCSTCHRGDPIPKQITDIVPDAAAHGAPK